MANINNNENEIKGIVFFDLDGTLLNDDTDKVPQSALRAIAKLKENGFRVVLSTGRDMETHYSRRYAEVVKPDAIIHINGNKITVGRELLFKHVMDKELLREVFEYSRAHGVCTGTSIGDEDFYTDPEMKVKADRTYSQYIFRNFKPVEELFTRNLEVSALSFAGDIRLHAEAFEQRFKTLKLLPFNTMAGADIVEEGFSKADGMFRVCDYYGIPYDRTYAFGDSRNDLHILKHAGVGVAMGNADPAAKEVADFVTDDIEENGIYNACVKLGLIEAD